MKETYILCNNQAERTAVLTKLEEEGFVITVHGKGTFVAATDKQLAVEARRKSVEDDLTAVFDKAQNIGMTKDEIIMELMELLKENGKAKQAAEVFECAAYVDMLENKLDQMTNELMQMRKELQEMKEQQVSKSLKETLSEMVDHAQVRCQQMKEKLFEVKNTVFTRNNAVSLIIVVTYVNMTDIFMKLFRLFHLGLVFV